MTEEKPKSLNQHKRRTVQLLLFVVMPVLAGLLTLMTGNLHPVFATMGIYLLPLISSSAREGVLAAVAPQGTQARSGPIAHWWTRRRRWGFYAAFSVLIALSLAFLRSALTDNWGGGDAVLAVISLLALFIIFRNPPHTVAGFGRRRSVAPEG